MGYSVVWKDEMLKQPNPPETHPPPFPPPPATGSVDQEDKKKEKCLGISPFDCQTTYIAGGVVFVLLAVVFLLMQRR